jgi:hypothetical protein
MSKNTNSASRLHSILTKVAGQQDSISIVDTWALAFGIQEKDGDRRGIEVTEQLRWLNHELTALRKQMETSTYSKELYETPFKRAAKALSLGRRDTLGIPVLRLDASP